MNIGDVEEIMWSQIHHDSRVLERCERCGERREIRHGICGTCADDLRDQRWRTK